MLNPLAESASIFLRKSPLTIQISSNISEATESSIISMISCYLATLIIGPDPGYGTTSTVGGLIVLIVKGNICLKSFPDESFLSLGNTVWGLICIAGSLPSYE